MNEECFQELIKRWSCLKKKNTNLCWVICFLRFTFSNGYFQHPLIVVFFSLLRRILLQIFEFSCSKTATGSSKLTKKCNVCSIFQSTNCTTVWKPTVQLFVLYRIKLVGLISKWDFEMLFFFHWSFLNDKKLACK